MVAIPSASDSPYLVLWYFFLAFLGAIIIVNVGALVVRKFIDWRTARFIKRYGKDMR